MSDPRRLSGDDLTIAVIDAAQKLGWRVAHFRPARTATGWRTPVQGDGAGFPDTVLVHSGRQRVLWRELKGDGDRVRPEQRDWLMWLSAAGEDAGVWTADDWRSGRVALELGR